MREIDYGSAGMEALQEEFRRDEKTVHLSTDISIPLTQEFGEARVRVTPISESAFVGAAIGLAVGFLYAPRPGREMRATIREKAEEAKDKAEEIIEEAKERGKRIIADAKGKAAEIKEE